MLLTPTRRTPTTTATATIPPFRLVVLGEGNVGKTSFVRSLYSDAERARMFPGDTAEPNSTIGVDFCVRTATLPHADPPRTVQLQIFDTAGHDVPVGRRMRRLKPARSGVQSASSMSPTSPSSRR